MGLESPQPTPSLVLLQESGRYQCLARARCCRLRHAVNSSLYPRRHVISLEQAKCPRGASLPEASL